MRTNHKIIRTQTELRELIQYCLEERVVSLDWETNGTSVHAHWFKPTGLGVSFRVGSGWFIPLAHPESPFEHIWESTLRQFAKAVFENPSIVKFVFNGLFEYRVALRFGYRFRGRFLDVMLMKYLLHEERPNDLKSLVDLLLPDFSGYDLDNKPGKNASPERIRAFWENVPIETLGKYCAGDSDFTLRLGYHFESKLIEHGLYHLFRNLYMPLVRILSVTILRGVLVDRAYLERQLEEFEGLIATRQKSMYEIPIIQDYNEDYIEDKVYDYITDLEREIDRGNLTDRQIAHREQKISLLEAGQPSTNKEQVLFEPINFGSPLQLVDLLYKSPNGFEFPVKERSDSGNPSTAESALLKLMGNDTSGFIKALLELRGLQKLYSTYIKSMYEEHLSPEDKVHPSYLLHGTVCVGENTILLGREGKIRIGDLVPKNPGEVDISSRQLFTLTHTGKYQRILIAVNKGLQDMIEIEDGLGNSLQCLPEHLLMTRNGWKTVSKILEEGLPVASFQPNFTIDTPKTTRPSREIILPVQGWDGYFVSNWGQVFTDKISGARGRRGPEQREMACRIVKGYRRVGFRNNSGTKKNFKVATLVFTHFSQNVPPGFVIDHINCTRTDDYITNLRLATGSENVSRAHQYSYRSYTYGEKNGESKFDIPTVLTIRAKYESGEYTQRELAEIYGSSQGHIGGIVRKERWAWLQETPLKLVRGLGKRLVCDIHVEEDESYITDSGFINHNTGRLSSREPNFQNIPRVTTGAAIKKMFIAPKDHFFVECVDPLAYVNTPGGLQPLHSLVAGESVTLAGESYTAINIESKGVKPTIKTVTNTGRSLITTHNHLFKTQRGFVLQKDLTYDDTLIIDNLLGGGATVTPPLEAYVAGLFYGDGFYSQNDKGRERISYRLGFSLGLDREELLPILQAQFPGQYISTVKPIPQAVMITSKPIYEEWSSKYPKKGSGDMRIPPQIMAGTLDSKLHFLGGLIDSDGSANSDRVRYTSVCEAFIDDLLLLANSCGVWGVKNTTIRDNIVAYHFLVYSQDSLAPLQGFSRLTRKRAMIDYMVEFKGASQCLTEMIPEAIYEHLREATARVGPYKPVGASLRNATRKRRLTRRTIRENIIPYMVDPMLATQWEEVLRYRYESIGEFLEMPPQEVMDITVPGARQFSANGFIVHNCDLSQAELRYAAEFFNDRAMLDIFKQGRNIHVATAALMFEIDYDLVNKARKDESHPQHEDMVKKHKSAKVLNFTIFYGAGANKVSEFLTERTGDYHSPQEAQEFIDRWFEAFPQAARGIKKERNAAVKDGYVTSLFGRKRRLPILLNPRNKDRERGKWNEALRQCVNAPIQGGSSDITQWINIQVYKDILMGKLPPYLHLVSTVHDSIEFYVHKDDLAKVLTHILNIASSLPEMKQYLGYALTRVPMKASAEYGINWGTMHPFEPATDLDKDFAQIYQDEISKLS